MPNAYEVMTNQEMHNDVVTELEGMGWTESVSDDYSTWLTKSVNVESWDIYLTVELPLDDPEEEAGDILHLTVESNVTIRYPDDYAGDGVRREIVESVASGVTLENITDNFPDHAYIDFIATGDVVRGRSPEILAEEINAYADWVAEDTADTVADVEDALGFAF